MRSVFFCSENPTVIPTESPTVYINTVYLHIHCEDGLDQWVTHFQSINHVHDVRIENNSDVYNIALVSDLSKQQIEEFTNQVAGCKVEDSQVPYGSCVDDDLITAEEFACPRTQNAGNQTCQSIEHLSSCWFCYSQVQAADGTIIQRRGGYMDLIRQEISDNTLDLFNLSSPYHIDHNAASDITLRTKDEEWTLTFWLRGSDPNVDILLECDGEKCTGIGIRERQLAWVTKTRTDNQSAIDVYFSPHDVTQILAHEDFFFG